MTMVLRCIRDDKSAFNGKEFVHFISGKTYIVPTVYAEQLIRKGSMVEMIAEVTSYPMMFVGTQIKIEQVTKQVVATEYKNKGFFRRIFKR